MKQLVIVITVSYRVFHSETRRDHYRSVGTHANVCVRSMLNSRCRQPTVLVALGPIILSLNILLLLVIFILWCII